MDQEHIAEEGLEGVVHNRVRSSCAAGQERHHACIQELDTEVVVHSNVPGMAAEVPGHRHNDC